jgi:hypothetical protein
MRNIKKILLSLLFVFVLFVFWQVTKEVPLEGNWKQHLDTISTAEFNGDKVTVRNVRNYRYGPTEADMHPAYYDKTYDLNGVKKIWYVTEPFNENKVAGHTFVSFEFESGDFLAISIEARKTEEQEYSIWKGAMRTYPLVYVAADERDVVLLRANLRKDRVYVYPIKLSKPENGRLLLVDMLTTMNELTTTKPQWYNTLFANCTSAIAKHVNKLSPDRISKFSWQLWLTASADELALKAGLIDTNLNIDEARKIYNINEASEKAGDVSTYSQDIRKFKK